ncbi:MAG: SPFH domain-containing protein [Patescibacteria group bacterium]
MTIVLAIAILLLGLGLFKLFFISVQPYEAIIITRFGKPVRSAGSGLAFIFWPIESAGIVHSLKRGNISLEMNAEAMNRDVVKLNINVEYQPDETGIIRFLGFKQDQIESAIQDRVKSLCTIEVRNRKSRDKVYEEIAAINNAMTASFENDLAVNGQTLERHYGIDLISIIINDPEYPKALADAELKKEIQQEENNRRKLEMKNLQKIARDLVEEAKKNGQDLNYQTALEITQRQFGIIKTEHKKVGLDIDTLKAMENIMPELARRISEWLKSNRPGKRQK